MQDRREDVGKVVQHFIICGDESKEHCHYHCTDMVKYCNDVMFDIFSENEHQICL